MNIISGPRGDILAFFKLCQEDNKDGGLPADRRGDPSGAWTTATVLWAYIENDIDTSEEFFKKGVKFLRETQVQDKSSNERLGWPNIQEDTDMVLPTAYALLVLLEEPSEQNIPCIIGGIQRLCCMQRKKPCWRISGFKEDKECWTRASCLSLVSLMKFYCWNRERKTLENKRLELQLKKLQLKVLKKIREGIKWLIENKKEDEKIGNRTPVYWTSSDEKKDKSVPATSHALEVLCELKSKAKELSEFKKILEYLDLTTNELNDIIEKGVLFLLEQEKNGSFPDMEERKVLPKLFYQSHSLGTPLAILALCKAKPDGRGLYFKLTRARASLMKKIFEDKEEEISHRNLINDKKPIWETAYIFAALGRLVKVVEKHEALWLIDLRENVRKLDEKLRKLEVEIIRSEENEVKRRILKSFRGPGVVSGISSAVFSVFAYFYPGFPEKLLQLLISVTFFSLTVFCATLYFLGKRERAKPRIDVEKTYEEEHLKVEKDKALEARKADLILFYCQKLDLMQKSLQEAEQNQQYLTDILVSRGRFLFAMIGISTSFIFALISFTILWAFFFEVMYSHERIIWSAITLWFTLVVYVTIAYLKPHTYIKLQNLRYLIGGYRCEKNNL